MTTTELSPAEANTFDYLIIGGGTAGCVIGSRLAEYLPQKRILMVEAGPSDYMNDKVLNLKDWLNLLGGELDYDYGTTEQPNGKYTPHLYHLSSFSICNFLCNAIPSEMAYFSWYMYLRTHKIIEK